MRSFFLFALVALLSGCGADDSDRAPAGDTMSAKDSLKKAISEDLPPPSDIRQFNWFYSAFVQAATSGDDSVFNAFVHPRHGLWIIHTEGAVPGFTRVMKVSEYTNAKGKRLLPMDRDKMIAAPKDEELPKIDCDQSSGYSKEGCFTSERNLFREEKMWQYAGLTPEQDKQVSWLASTITRTVVNTSMYRFYFSLIDGGWYLTFVDTREPCSA